MAAGARGVSLLLALGLAVGPMAQPAAAAAGSAVVQDADRRTLLGGLSLRTPAEIGRVVPAGVRVAQNGGEGGEAVDPFLQPVENVDTEAHERRVRRRRMLKWHQGLALSALGLLTAQNIVGQMLYARYQGFGATQNLQSVHRYLGYTTFGVYTAAASLAILAPRVSDRPDGFQLMNVHRGLAWVHGIGMMIQPWFGLYTASRREEGASFEELQRLRQGHLAAGWATWGALGGAALVIVFD